MSTKRPSVTSLSDLIQKYQGSDFDVVKMLDARIAQLENIVNQIPNIPELVALAPQIVEFLNNDTYVSAPLLDNPVDFTAEGFPAEDTLGAIITALALLSKINEQDIANISAPLAAGQTAEGTAYDPLGGGYDPSFTDVKRVLDALKSIFNQTGSIVLADNATQTSAFNYNTSPAVANLPNDGAGASTDSIYAAPGTTSFYDVILNQLELSQFRVGDTLTFRLDLDIAPSVAEQEIDLLLSLAEGTPEASVKLIDRKYFKNATTYNVTAEITVLLNRAEILNNPGHIQIQSANNASVVVNTFEVFSNIKN